MAATTVSHRERLLREGTRQFYEHGFHGTTVDGILTASGVPKGSFYHHFGSKEEFAKQVLARYMDFQLDRLATWAARADLSTPDLVAGYFRDLADLFVRSRHSRACLAGKLATELAPGHREFRRQLRADLTTWRTRLVEILARGQERGDVRADQDAGVLADTVLALLQGAFVVALAARDDASLDAVCTGLRLILN